MLIFGFFIKGVSCENIDLFSEIGRILVFVFEVASDAGTDVFNIVQLAGLVENDLVDSVFKDILDCPLFRCDAPGQLILNILLAVGLLNDVSLCLHVFNQSLQIEELENYALQVLKELGQH